MSSKRSRRDFFRMSTALAGASMLPASICEALAIPADRRTGSIQDVKHVVILMQENRSFDHYYGTLRGVRGFGDPRPVLLPDGKPIWYQPPAQIHTKHYKDRGLSDKAKHVLPWYINPLRTTEHQAGTDHGWASGHGAWNDGRWNQWVNQKQDVLTMGHLKREDVSFHFALAEAFTLCDAYFCSVHANTCPNRIYLWSGTCDSRNVLGRKRNGPGLWERAHTNGYTWTTYPERLEKAGITWKLYQGGTGEAGTPTDNYTDNSLEFFAAYQVKEGADPNGPLVRKGVSNHTLQELREDVLAGKLAQVSWIVAPYQYCEHPEASPADGAYFINKVLEALTANPEVWGGTVLFLNYDENDGLFDHVIPPVPPITNAVGSEGQVSHDLEGSLQDEFLDLDRYPAEEHSLIPGYIAKGLQPIGLGPRVPMTIVSPWTRGGWVCSQVFDHTSVLRFLEARFGIAEPNISAWRRSICGDLTSAFDFAGATDTFPKQFDVPKPSMTQHLPYSVPEAQHMPQQESGQRFSRALPYELLVDGYNDNKGFWIRFRNKGIAGAAFFVQNRMQPEAAPRRYAVAAGDMLSDVWRSLEENPHYDLIVHGPHGYLRHFRGGAAENPIEVEVSYLVGTEALIIRLTNSGAGVVTVLAEEHYSKTRREFAVPPGTVEQRWNVETSHGWYDVCMVLGQKNFLRRYAGHIETGRPSMSDPALG